MLFVRSLAFNLSFYTFLIGYMIVIFPILFFPRKQILWVPKIWAYVSLWLLKTIVGLKFEIRGGENLQKGAILIAAKHQSVWETFALLTITKDPTYILKRQLMFIPLFGWYALKFKLISVYRGRGQNTLKPMIKQAQHAILENRQIIIFPEGTRRPPGASPAYKYGIVALYKMLHLPVLPIAHNAGLFWPRRSFLKYPGTVTMEILPSIPPLLSEKEFRKQLIVSIETASNKLLQKAKKDFKNA